MWLSRSGGARNRVRGCNVAASCALWHGETHPCCRCGSQWRMRAALERAASTSHCGEPTDTSLDQSPACRLGRAGRARAQSAHDHVVNGGRVLEYNKVSMVLRKLKS